MALPNKVLLAWPGTFFYFPKLKLLDREPLERNELLPNELLRLLDDELRLPKELLREVLDRPDVDPYFEPEAWELLTAPLLPNPPDLRFLARLA